MLSAGDMQTAWIVYVAAAAGCVACLWGILPSRWPDLRRLLCVLTAILLLTPSSQVLEQGSFLAPVVMMMIFSLFEPEAISWFKLLWPLVLNSVIAMVVLVIFEWFRRNKVASREAVVKDHELINALKNGELADK
ncbi:MAG: hypothetical protein K6L73_07015 [Cellvibrionaceae bacterium]